MLNLGLTEIIVVLVVAIIVVGPERLPTVVRWLGRQYGKLMRSSDELRKAFVIEADRAEAEVRAKELRKRRDEARARIEEARRNAAVDATQPQPMPAPFPNHSDDEKPT